jgi:hypothetical protein
VRWDNLAIIGIALVSCVIVVPMLLGVDFPLGDHGKNPNRHEAKDSTAANDAPVSSMTDEQAMAAVASAREQMKQGHWDEAERLIAPIMGDQAVTTGADQLDDEIAANREAYESHSNAAREADSREDWQTVIDEIAAVEAIAPMPADFAGMRDNAKNKLIEQKALHSVQLLLKAGSLDEAYDAAKGGFDRYGTSSWATLLGQIEKARDDSARDDAVGANADAPAHVSSATAASPQTSISSHNTSNNTSSSTTHSGHTSTPSTNQPVTGSTDIGNMNIDDILATAQAQYGSIE